MNTLQNSNLNHQPHTDLSRGDKAKTVRGTIGYTTISIEAGALVESYIQRPSTVNAISKMFGLSLQPSSSLYKYTEGDKIVVVAMKKPVRGSEAEVKPEDLEFFIVQLMEEW